MKQTEIGRTFLVVPKKPRVFQRPPQAEEIVRSILGSVDCVRCAQCCRGRTFPIPISRAEADSIRRFLAAKNRKLELGYISDTGLQVPHGECVLLQSSPAGFPCLAYSVRPSACNSFPFNPVNPTAFVPFDGIYQELLHAGAIPQNTLGLTASCPPMLRIAEQGISYLLLSDLLDPTPKFMESALLWLGIMASQSQVVLPKVLLDGQMKIFLPLLDLPGSVVIANSLRRISGYYPRPPQETP